MLNLIIDSVFMAIFLSLDIIISIHRLSIFQHLVNHHDQQAFY